jgi:hypothetical protein
MIVHKQKPISFNNACNAQYEEWQLEQAILWYSQIRPVCQLKKIFMHGKYPAVSIHGEKLHIHRLLMSWYKKRRLGRTEYVHHKDHDKMNGRLSNLVLLPEKVHQSLHNKGKIVSQETRRKHTESNKRN